MTALRGAGGVSDRPSGRVEQPEPAPLAEQAKLSLKRADCSGAGVQPHRTPRLGRRRLEQLGLALTVRDWQVLHDVARCRLIQGSQVRRLHFPSTEHASPDAAARAARRCLARLTDQRVLLRLERRIGGLHAGSEGIVYGLGPTARRLLGERRPGGWREPSLSFVQHTLAVSEWYVRLAEAAQDNSCELLRLQVEVESWRRFTGLAGERQVLAPDLFVHLAVEDLELAWFVEVDLGTEHRRAVTTKAERYVRYYQSGTEQASLGFFPRVLWITEDEQRAVELERIFSKLAKLVPSLLLTASVDRALVLLMNAPLDVERA